MDKEIIKEANKKLLEINKTISSLDPAIRSKAFDILAKYYFEDYEDLFIDEVEIKKKHNPLHSNTTASLEKFIENHEHEKPSKNVFLIAAWLFSQHGVVPITMKMYKKIADDTGVTIPNRPDNTLRGAKENNKKLFVQKGDGWKPTTSGEIHLKNTFKVNKGSKPLEDISENDNS